MCGIAGIFGNSWSRDDLLSMVRSQRHRGPDGEGIYFDPAGVAGLGHNRLSIIDLSSAGDQPMRSVDGKQFISLNGEIYNYLELKRELQSEYEFKTRSDTEVLLAAYRKWGARCLDRLIGMFAFIIWDEAEKTAFIARDRFGVKPLYYHQKPDGTLLVSSEIKALHSAGIDAREDVGTWATYLAYGLYDHSPNTFWRNVQSLPAGHSISWKDGQTRIAKWYDLADMVGSEPDRRPEHEVEEEYFALMKDSISLRFRSDVPVGINLSGGLDSSGLLGLVHEVQGRDSDVKAFTFITGDTDYDELPWVERMLEKTNHPLIVSRLDPQDVPSLAESVHYHQDEPYAGLPTLAYAKLFEKARAEAVTVLLDGNGMDEQWAGYDYYAAASTNGEEAGLIQGTRESPVRADCLVPDFRSLAVPLDQTAMKGSTLLSLQYRDALSTKIPRAMRFNDRISMRSSTELREPFLDHRLFELALRQPDERKISNGTRKKMLRDISARFIPKTISGAPKRPMQTPQREWLRGPLRNWAESQIDQALAGQFGSFLDKHSVKRSLEGFFRGESDNSFYIWQWISMGLMSRPAAAARTTT